MLQILTAILGGFAALIPMMITFFGRKLVVIVAAIAAFIAITMALIVALKAAVTSMAAYLVLPTWLASIAWFIPSNFLTVFSIIVSAHVTRAAYDIAVEKIRLITSAT